MHFLPIVLFAQPLFQTLNVHFFLFMRQLIPFVLGPGNTQTSFLWNTLNSTLLALLKTQFFKEGVELTTAPCYVLVVRERAQAGLGNTA